MIFINLNDVKYEMSNCTLIGDRAYLSKTVQLYLFEQENIQLEVPMRANQKDFEPVFKPFRKVRKRVETLFSQLDDQFLLLRNYDKDTQSIFTGILAKITSATVLQLINKMNYRPIARIKHALI